MVGRGSLLSMMAIDEGIDTAIEIAHEYGITIYASNDRLRRMTRKSWVEIKTTGNRYNGGHTYQLTASGRSTMIEEIEKSNQRASR